MTQRRILHVLAVTAALVLAGVCRAGDVERFFRVLISDAPAGWMRSAEVTADGRITSRAEMIMKMKRGPIEIAIAMKSEFVETQDGEPVSLFLRQELGTQPIETRCTFTPQGLEVETTQTGQTTKALRPLPEGEWLCPAEAIRELRERLAAGDKDFVLTTIDPMGGVEVARFTHQVVGPDTVTVRGKPVAVTKATVETSQLPGVKNTAYYGADGYAVKTETFMGGLTMTMIEAGPEVMSESGRAPELMLSTFVKPDRPIENPRGTGAAVYVLSIPDGTIPELPTTGAQKAEALAPNRARLTIDAADLAPAPDEDGAADNYLASTTAANFEDPSVKRLATRALREAPDDKTERAEMLRRYVHRFIHKKNLDVGMATATEIARNRAGDCSEHGVLLAALLRADGIPSRVATGLMYVDEFAGATGVFGYHMWTQALLEKDGVKRWVDLDATLPNSTPFDATHITLSTSDLADTGGLESMAALISVIGQLEIKVESVE